MRSGQEGDGRRQAREAGPSARKRRPVRNFIFLPELQWPYIIRVAALVNLAGVIMAAVMGALFYFRFYGDPGEDLLTGPLAEENLMDVVIPAFIISDLVSLVIGVVLALYFSRKISVPVYRLQRWSKAIAAGDLSQRLRFRPGDDLKMLEKSCNEVGETYARLIDDLRRKLSEADLPDSPQLQKLRSTLERLKT